MLEWFTVIALIVFGIGLIVLEVVFVPGTTFVGIFGFVIGILGIYLSFRYFGTSTGITVTLLSVVAGFVSMFYSLRSNAWERFALKSSINSRFNDEIVNDLEVGEAGKTVSSLRPMGKAEFRDKIFEVTTNGDYLDAGKPVKIIQIKTNKILVEPINN